MGPDQSPACRHCGKQGNAAGGHAGAVEAVLWLAPFTMTPRRFPAPWRAEPIPGGYVVRDATARRSANSRLSAA